MNVYRLEADATNYQYFLAAAEEDEEKLITDCTPIASRWQPPSVYVYKPRLKIGDFFNFHGGSLILSPKAIESLRMYLEMAGELLPLPFESEVYALLNVTECINCLDRKNTEWLYAEDAWPIKRYVFQHDRFSESEIFKIPETCKAEVLIVERRTGEGFVQALRDYNIKGYKLDLLWSD